MKLQILLKYSLAILFLLSFSSCGKNSDYALYESISPVLTDKRIYPLSLLEIDKDIDILFIIDNSGSMSTIQDNVIKNSKIFMNQFIKQPYINWKMGLISTDMKDAPYLGFNKSFDASLIDFNDPNSFNKVIETFQDAVAQLGTVGSGVEHVFYNIKTKIDQYDNFLRPSAHLVIVMITDEPEQSQTSFGSAYEPKAFYNTMLLNVPSNRVLRFYGALSFKELTDCTESPDPYKGSPFETVIDLSHGFTISACTPNFGTDLAKIGSDIASLVGQSALPLRERPKPETIKVYYKNKLLSPGPKEKGGLWYYEHSTNTVNFYNISFVDDPSKDHFKIDFIIDE